jgi:DNA-directed RNA polymerase specialized sigma24 family protein
VDPSVVVPLGVTRVESFDAFYRSSWRAAAVWAAALTGDVHAGQEIAQEVFIRVADRYDRLDNP